MRSEWKRSSKIAVVSGITLLCFGISAASALTAVSAPGNTSAAPKAVASMTWNLNPQPTSLDVNGSGETNQAAQYLFCDHLLNLGTDIKLHPYLATSFKYTTPLTLVFTIKQGVKYWDGTPLTTADVVWNLQRQKDNPNNVAASFVAKFANVSSISQTGKDKVTIRFSKRTNSFLYGIAGSMGMIQKPAFVQAAGTANGSAKGGVMCSGPYELKSWQPGDSMVATANPSYWNKAYLPKVQTITVKFVADSNALASALQSGEIDGTYNFPQDILQRLEGSGAGKLYGGKTLTWDSIATTDYTGAVKDTRIRQALARVIDRSALVKLCYKGAGRPNPLAYSSPTAFTYQQAIFNKVYRQFSYLLKPTVAQAKQLVAQAGAPKSINLYFQAGNPTFLCDATVIQQEAQSIGLDLKLQPLNAAALNAIMLNVNQSARVGTDLWLRHNVISGRDPNTFAIVAYAPGQPFFFDNPNQAMANDIFASEAATNEVTQAKMSAAALASATSQANQIGLVYSTSTLYLNKRLTGANPNDYWYSPWATLIGGK